MREQEVVDTMHSDSSVETGLYDIISDVGPSDVSCHMEVNWIPAQFGGLSNIAELHILDSTHNVALSWRKHDVSTVLM
jgi:hypothetical protein